jgi:hypothetical protein
VSFLHRACCTINSTLYCVFITLGVVYCVFCTKGVLHCSTVPCNAVLCLYFTGRGVSCLFYKGRVALFNSTLYRVFYTQGCSTALCIVCPLCRVWCIVSFIHRAVQQHPVLRLSYTGYVLLVLVQSVIASKHASKVSHVVIMALDVGHALKSAL